LRGDGMDFGRILDDWETIKREHKDSAAPTPRASQGPPDDPSEARGALEAWLEKNAVSDKDAEEGASANGFERNLEARRLASLKPEAVLDLHGMTAEAAESAIAAFLDASSRMGLEKVLIIHGKGLHSSGAPVLKKAARRAIEAHPAAGRFGEAKRTEGGSGALWVLIRKKN
jgi:DNA-nicking Smr family endonuclease